MFKKVFSKIIFLFFIFSIIQISINSEKGFEKNDIFLLKSVYLKNNY